MANKEPKEDMDIGPGRGRQSLYTPERAALICERIAHGESLVAISGKRGLPSYQTIMGWLKAHSDFEMMYRKPGKIRPIL